MFLLWDCPLYAVTNLGDIFENVILVIIFTIIYSFLPVAETHSFSCGSTFIQKRGVGYLQPCEVSHHGLVVEETFQSSLGHLGLIGGVLCSPGKQ